MAVSDDTTGQLFAGALRMRRGQQQNEERTVRKLILGHYVRLIPTYHLVSNWQQCGFSLRTASLGIRSQQFAIFPLESLEDSH